MNGFPRGSSPFCPGKFCGSNTLVYGDLLQAVINSITPDIYRTYTANRSAVRDRVLTRPDDIDIPTRQVLQQALSACTQEDDENSET